MFSALLLPAGKVIATSHVSPAKVQLLAGASAGLGLPALTNAACSLFGAAPWVGPVEGLTAAVVVALVAGVWARGLPAAAQNAMTAQQVRRLGLGHLQGAAFLNQCVLMLLLLLEPRVRTLASSFPYRS